MPIKKIVLFNILIFLIIFLITSIHYYNHFNKFKKEILNYVEFQAESIAKRIEIATSNIYRSNRFIFNIIQKNLLSQAKFIDLLNSIEEFKWPELKEYCKETNIDLIGIFYPNREIIYSKLGEKPEDLKKLALNYMNKLYFNIDKKIILFFYKSKYTNNAIIIIGIKAKKFFKARKRFNVKNLIKRIINQRKDILDIKILRGTISKSSIKFKDRYYEVLVPLEGEKNKFLLIKVDAQYPLKIISNFKHNLIVFIIVLFLLVLCGNIIIYFIQKYYIERLKKVEKKLFEQEKQASLGRSAALIAHEIRNPVNAVSIGIQRILYETDITKNPEYSNLLNTISDELKRINTIIEKFLDYTKPLKLNFEKVNLKEIIENQLTLYKQSFKNIKIIFKSDENIFLNGDKSLLKQAFMNILKNIFDNEKTTYCKIDIINEDKKIIVIFENDGIIKDIDVLKIFEPYYTTKTRGSGLGLAVVKKIVEAHNGEISCVLIKDKIQFKIEFFKE